MSRQIIHFISLSLKKQHYNGLSACAEWRGRCVCVCVCVCVNVGGCLSKHLLRDINDAPGYLILHWLHVRARSFHVACKYPLTCSWKFTQLLMCVNVCVCLHMLLCAIMDLRLSKLIKLTDIAVSFLC